MVYLSGNGRGMSSEIETEQITPAPGSVNDSVPWKFIDNWVGVALLALIDVVIFIIMLRAPKADLAQSSAIVLLELAYLLPVILIFAWRGIHWKYLRFGTFQWNMLGIGCGLLVVSYM